MKLIEVNAAREFANTFLPDPILKMAVNAVLDNCPAAEEFEEVNMIEYIREKLTTEELLAQLAEEATELAHAALKYRRVLDGTNPTPATAEDAMANLQEEIADVRLVLELLYLTGKPEQTAIMAHKLARWAGRLAEKHGEADRGGK